MAKTIMTCAVTGGGPIGKHPAIPSDAQGDRRGGDRRRQGRRGHRPYPCARAQDRPGQHGAGLLPRGGGAHPRQRQSTCSSTSPPAPGAMFVPSKDDPGMPGPGTNMCSRRGADAPRGRAEARHLLARSLHHVEPHPRLHERARDPDRDGEAHPRRGRAARARMFRQRRHRARQGFHQERRDRGAGAVPARARHPLWRGGDARDDDLHARPAAARARAGPRSASRARNSRWWRRRCCWAGMCASGSRTTTISSAACSPTTRSSSRRAVEIIRLLGGELATPDEAREMLGLAQVRARAVA